jgi:hypothetical protein
MRKRTIAVVVAGLLALGAIGAGVAVATGGDDGNEAAISGPALQRASEAALSVTGGGKVTDTEVGDEESYYEVEVTRPDGSQVDVQLNRDFSPAGQSADQESPDDSANE